MTISRWFGVVVWLVGYNYEHLMKDIMKIPYDAAFSKWLTDN